MAIKDTVSTIIEKKNIPMDIRMEVAVADLLKSGYSLDDYFVRPIGIFKRTIRKHLENRKRDRRMILKLRI